MFWQIVCTIKVNPNLDTFHSQLSDEEVLGSYLSVLILEGFWKVRLQVANVRGNLQSLKLPRELVSILNFYVDRALLKDG